MNQNVSIKRIKKNSIPLILFNALLVFIEDFITWFYEEGLKIKFKINL